MKLDIDILIIRHTKTQKIWFASVVKNTYNASIQIDGYLPHDENPFLPEEFKKHFLGTKEVQHLENSKNFEVEFQKKQIEIL